MHSTYSSPPCMSSPMRATEFPRFASLPAELRLFIWQHAMPGPRTIHLVEKSPYYPRRPTQSEDIHKFTILTGPEQRKVMRREAKERLAKSHCVPTIKYNRPIRALLHACRESRLEALCRYEPLFAPKSLDNPDFCEHYFDPLVDGIFLDSVWPWKRGGNSIPTGVFNARHLSISCNAWHFSYHHKDQNLLGRYGLLRFKHLEELHIVWRVPTREEEAICRDRFPGTQVGPGAMTMLLHRPDAPHDIAFPEFMVEVCVKEILKKFAAMKKACPDWNVPVVKNMGWATKRGKLIEAPAGSVIAGSKMLI